MSIIRTSKDRSRLIKVKVKLTLGIMWALGVVLCGPEAVLSQYRQLASYMQPKFRVFIFQFQKALVHPVLGVVDKFKVLAIDYWPIPNRSIPIV